MGLSISTTPARISIQTYPGKFDMNVVDSKLEQTSRQPKVNITTEHVRILINQYPCFAEEGLKNNMDFAVENAQRGYRSLLEYTAKTAQDGDQMAQIGRKANIMINIAMQSSITTHEFGMVTMPMSRPEIDFTGGTVKFQPEFLNNVGEINGVTGNYIPGEITYNYTSSKVNLQMLSYGSVNISYTGNNIDSYI